MSGPPHDRGKAPPPQWPLKPADSTAKSTGSGSASASDKGKVVHDDRGNAKWDLGLDTSRVKKLTTSQLLKQLDISDLALLDEQPSTGPKAIKPKPGGGFDPYEPAETRLKPALRPGAAIKPTPTSAPKPGTAPNAGRPPAPLPGKPRR